MMDDLISRQAAVDRINKQREHLQPDIYPQDKIGDAAYQICAEFIERLPSAQPYSKELSSTHKALDTISRQAAIDALECKKDKNAKGDIGGFYNKIIQNDIDVLMQLPSAQPEIIRCRDCKHLQKWRSEESAKKFGQIYECARNVLNCPTPEDFCSRFERRTDER